MVTLQFTPTTCLALLRAIDTYWPGVQARPNATADLERLLRHGEAKNKIITIRFSRADAVEFDKSKTSRTLPRSYATYLRHLMIEVVRWKGPQGLPRGCRAAVRSAVMRLDAWLDTPIVERIAVLDV